MSHLLGQLCILVFCCFFFLKKERERKSKKEEEKLWINLSNEKEKTVTPNVNIRLHRVR